MTVKRLSLVASKQSKQYYFLRFLLNSKISRNNGVLYSFFGFLTVACPKQAF